MKIPVAPDGANESEIFRMCISGNMAIHAIEITTVQVSGNLVPLHPGSFNLFCKRDAITKYEMNKVLIHPVS